MSARSVAYELLEAVDERDAYANLELPKLLTGAGLSQRDRGFATELGYGALRMRGFNRAVIDTLVPKGVDSLDAPTLRVLELGVQQLCGMQMPAHAVVNESVNLARSVGSARSSGLINAVLRRVSERTPTEWAARITETLTGNASLSAELSHPLWVIDALEDALKREGRESELQTALEANNHPAAVSLVVLPTASEATRSNAGEIFAPGSWSPYAARSTGGALGKLPQGVRVQDEGSQLVAATLAHASLTEQTPEQPNHRWLDACAGPGGKAAYLAAEAQLAGASLTARDVNATRVQLIRNAMSDAGFSETDVQVEVGDARESAAVPGTYERILLDVPCTGLGALRRRPEARWRKQESDVAQLASLQEQILTAGLKALAPGGVLMYATCSPLPAETTEVVARALQATQGYEPLNTAEAMNSWLEDVGGTPVPDVEVRGTYGGTAVQLWPHRHDTDAMFFQLIRRVG